MGLSTARLLDQALERDYGKTANVSGGDTKKYLLVMPNSLWLQVQDAAKLDNQTVAEFVRGHIAAASQERIHRDEAEKQSVSLCSNYLRISGRSSLADPVR